VLLLVVAGAGGLIAGRARRPAGGHGAHPHVRRWRLLALGALLAVVATLLHGDVAVLCSALSIAALAVFAGTNRNVTGLAVAGLGLVLNLAAVVLNNGMPVRAEALRDSRAVRGHVDRSDVRSPRHLETGSDGFGWLGAIVPVPGVHDVVSFGDLIVLVGVFDAARELARRRTPLPAVGDDVDELFPIPPRAAGAGTSGGATAQLDDPASSDATTAASADQDWGAAPSAAPESGSQCSAKPFTTTADINEFWKEAALPPAPAHLAARQDR
jgi:hypothetical protein